MIGRLRQTDICNRSMLRGLVGEAFRVMALEGFLTQSDMDVSSARGLVPSLSLRGPCPMTWAACRAYKKKPRESTTADEKTGERSKKRTGLFFPPPKRTNLSFALLIYLVYMYRMSSFFPCGALSPSVVRLLRCHRVCFSGSLRLRAGGCGGGWGGSWRRRSR